MTPGPRFFATPDEWRRWLEENHATAPEVLFGFYRKGSGHPTVTWQEAVDGALCFGWIDSVKRKIDDERYSLRFTPRRARSIWSEVNVRRVAALTEAGLMAPAGVRAFEARSEDRTGIYSFEKGKNAALAPADEKRLRASGRAWKFFESRPASYKRAVVWWIVSARQEATRQRRLDLLLTESAAGRTVKQFTRAKRQ